MATSVVNVEAMTINTTACMIGDNRRNQAATRVCVGAGRTFTGAP